VAVITYLGSQPEWAPLSVFSERKEESRVVQLAWLWVRRHFDFNLPLLLILRLIQSAWHFAILDCNFQSFCTRKQFGCWFQLLISVASTNSKEFVQFPLERPVPVDVCQLGSFNLSSIISPACHRTSVPKTRIDVESTLLRLATEALLWHQGLWFTNLQLSDVTVRACPQTLKLKLY